MQHLDRRRRASGRKRRPDPCAACPVRMFSSLKPCRCLPHQVATSSARQRRAQRPVPIRIALSSRPDSPAKPRPMVWPAHPCEARGVEQRPIRSPGLRGGVASDSTGRSRLGPNGRLRTCRNSPYPNDPVVRVRAPLEHGFVVSATTQPASATAPRARILLVSLTSMWGNPSCVSCDLV